MILILLSAIIMIGIFSVGILLFGAVFIVMRQEVVESIKKRDYKESIMVALISIIAIALFILSAYGLYSILICT